MKKLQFTIKINAPKEKVWDTLWNDTTFRDWAGFIDEGTYLVGELKEGNEVQFISSVGGFGVTSKIINLISNEFISFHHNSDTEDFGGKEREEEWTGGTESYLLTETNGVTTLTLESDVPPSQEEMSKDRFPKALERIRFLSEK